MNTTVIIFNSASKARCVFASTTEPRKRYTEPRRHKGKTDDKQGHEYKGDCLPQWAEPLLPRTSVQKKSKPKGARKTYDAMTHNVTNAKALAFLCRPSSFCTFSKASK